MRASMLIFAGVCAGLLGSFLVERVPVSAQDGRGRGALAPLSGDANGDGVLDLSDAVFILNYLFLGASAPVEIDCGPPDPPAGGAMYRLNNNLVCNGQGFTAQIEVCGSTASDLSGNSTPSACTEIASSATCSVRAFGTAPSCGSFEVCGEIPVREGYVYDFVVLVEGSVVVYWFEKELDASGDCPAPPVPGTPPRGILSGACAGGAGDQEAGFANSAPWW